MDPSTLSRPTWNAHVRGGGTDVDTVRASSRLLGQVNDSRRSQLHSVFLMTVSPFLIESTGRVAVRSCVRVFSFASD